MFPFKKYLVGSSDQFDPEYFSFVIDDVAVILDQTRHIAPDFKAEIIVSFLKTHSLQNEWIAANPELVKLVTSKSLACAKIEALFDSCQNNPLFGQQLETYLKGKIAEV